MVRPIQDGYVRPLTDAESSSGTFTDVGDDGVDFDGGGGSDPGGGGGVIVAPAAEALEVVPSSGSGVTLDFSVANWWDITLTANCTLSISNPPASGTVGILHVILRQGGSGSYTVTWPAEVEWPDADGTDGGPAPTLWTVVGSANRIDLTTEDGGTTYDGATGEASDPNAELNIEGGQDVIKAHGSMGSTETFDPTDGNVHTGTLNANCTFTLSAPAGSGACTLELWLTEDATGGRTVTWPGSVTEQGTHDTTLNTLQRVVLETIDGGTSWIATWIGSGTSFTTPSITYGTPAAGSGSNAIRANATIAKPTAADVDFSSDVTTSNATTGHHGLLPKLDNTATHYLDGTGAWSTPAGSGSSSGSDHAHVMDILFSGDGSTTAFTLPASPVDAYSVQAFVAGVLTEVTLSGSDFTTATFGSAPGAASNNVRFDIIAATL